MAEVKQGSAAEVRRILAEGKEQRLWDDAVRRFKEEQLADGWTKAEGQLDDFVNSMSSAKDARLACSDVEKKADKKYMTKSLTIGGKVIISGTFIKTTLANIDSFIAVVDVATKGGSEAVSVAWSCIKLVLKAFQSDSANCAMWAQAAECMSRILCTCQTLAKIYSTSRINPESNQPTDEVVVDLLNLIPNTYKAILSFSWAAKVQLDHSTVHRFWSQANPFSRSANASSSAFKTIKDSDKLIKEQSQVAFQKISTEAQNSLLDGQDDIKDTLKELVDLNNKTLASYQELGEKVAEKVGDKIADKIKQLQSPAEVERHRFSDNKTLLKPSKHSLELLTDKLKNKEPGTCEWIFKDVQEFDEWQQSPENALLWICGEAGNGKSVLMSNIIDRVRNDGLDGAPAEIAEDEAEPAEEAPTDAASTVPADEEADVADTAAEMRGMRFNEDYASPLVAYFFCRNAGENEASSSAIRVRQDIVFRIYEALYDDEDRLADANRVFVKGGNSSKRNKQQGGGQQADQQQRSAAQTQDSGKTAGKLPDMGDAFIELARILDRPIVVIVDALDECVDLIEEELIDTLKLWISEKDIKVKIVVSSRPEQKIESEIASDALKIDIQRYNKRDIRRKTDGELKKIRNLRPADRRKVRDRIVQKAQNQFTYVDIAMKFLQQPWVFPIENVLNRLSDNVQRIYQESLRSTDPSYLPLAKLVLKWTLLRQGPLNVQELYDVYSQRFLATNSSGILELENGGEEPEENESDEQSQQEGSEDEEEDDESDDSGSEPADDWEPSRLFADQIKIAARNLVVVQGEDKHLEWYHHTVKETFLHQNLLLPSRAATMNGTQEDQLCVNCKTHVNDSKSGDYHVHPEGHLDIAIVLLRHLKSSEFLDEYYGWHGTLQRIKNVFAPPEENSESNAVDENGAVVNGDGEHDGETNDANTEDVPGAAENENTEEDAPVKGEGKVQDVSEPPTAVNGREEPTADADVNGEDAEVAAEAPSDAPALEEEYNYDGSNSEDMEDFFDDRGNTFTGFVPEPVRYEILALPWHIKEAENASNGDLSSFGAKFEEFWRELDEFFKNPVSFQWWTSAYFLYRQQDDSGLRFLLSDDVQPIHVAATFGWTSIARRLVEEGASLTATTEVYSNTPLICFRLNSSMDKDLELLDLLLTHTDVSEMSEGQINDLFLYFFLSTPSSEITKRLVEWFHGKLGRDCNVADDVGDNAFHFMSYRRAQKDVVKILVDAGVQINSLNNNGKSPLHILLQSIDVDYQTVDDFLAAGADLNMEGGDSKRPLVGAAQNGEVDIVRKLIAAHADVDDLDEDGRTALHSAAAFGRTEVIQLLLEKSTTINLPSKEQITPFFAACNSGEESAAQLIFDQLKHLPTDEIDFATKTNKTPFRKACLSGFAELVKQMIQLPDFDKSRLNMVDRKKGWSALHVAAQNAQTNVVRILLDQGIDYACVDRVGKTALQVCYEKWAESPKDEFEDVVNELIDADIDAARKNTRLLHIAASKGSTKIVEKLLNIGIHRSTEDNHGWTARTYARNQGHTEVINLLDQGGVVGHFPSTLNIGAVPVLHRSDDDPNRFFLDTAQPYGTGALADHPIPAGQNEFYFEVTIIKGWCGVGFSTYNDRSSNWMPGHGLRGVRSWGYHGDDGNLFVSSRGVQSTFATFEAGDVIGAYYNVAENYSVMIKNARNAQYFQVPPTTGPLFPVVGFVSEGATAKVNFGQEAFSNQLGAKLESPEVHVEKPNMTLEWSSTLIEPYEDDKLRYWSDGESHTGSVLFYDHPLSKTGEAFYFEIKIIDVEDEGFVAIGVSSYVAVTDGWAVGWYRPSIRTWAYHGDDARLYTWLRTDLETEGETLGFPTYGMDDVIGCGGNLAEDTMYFTKNGELVGTISRDLSKLPTDMRLFPGMGMSGRTDVKVNFGDEEFMYKPQAA